MKRGIKIGVVVVVCITLLFALTLGYFYIEKRKLMVIGSGAMAPSLCGPHVRLACPNCGFAWPANFNQARKEAFSGNLECPNCGNPFKQLIEPSNSEDGDTVAVVTIMNPSKELRRWDIAVFCPTNERKRQYAMRLVGMPGEIIDFYNGNIYINEKIARKPPVVQDILLIEVYNSSFIPRNGVTPWEFYGESWKIEKGKLSVSLADKGKRASGSAEFTGRLDSSLPYNALQDSGYSEWNTDIVLEFTYTILSPSGTIGGVIEAGARHSCEFSLRMEERKETSVRLRLNGVSVDTATLPALTRKKNTVKFCTLDGIARFIFNGDEILNVQIESEAQAGAPRVLINAEECNCIFSNIRILKDNYYTSRSGETKIPLGHYFFLADNSSAGKDSRSFGAIPEERIIGKVTGILYSSNR